MPDNNETPQDPGRRRFFQRSGENIKKAAAVVAGMGVLQLPYNRGRTDLADELKAEPPDIGREAKDKIKENAAWITETAETHKKAGLLTTAGAVGYLYATRAERGRTTVRQDKRQTKQGGLSRRQWLAVAAGGAAELKGLNDITEAAGRSFAVQEAFENLPELDSVDRKTIESIKSRKLAKVGEQIGDGFSYMTAGLAIATVPLFVGELKKGKPPGGDGPAR